MSVAKPAAKRADYPPKTSLRYRLALQLDELEDKLD
jgi:hypothetical protein